MGVMVRGSDGIYREAENPLVLDESGQCYRESVGLVQGKDGVYREAWNPEPDVLWLYNGELGNAPDRNGIPLNECGKVTGGLSNENRFNVNTRNITTYKDNDKIRFKPSTSGNFNYPLVVSQKKIHLEKYNKAFIDMASVYGGSGTGYINLSYIHTLKTDIANPVSNIVRIAGLPLNTNRAVIEVDISGITESKYIVFGLYGGYITPSGTYAVLYKMWLEK